MGHVRKVPSKRQAVVDDDTKLNLLLALEENPITPAPLLFRQRPAESVSNFPVTVQPIDVDAVQMHAFSPSPLPLADQSE
ncbi:hypothetical protein NQ318_003205 [Aromia moschata]|uniref:Uncharacterized protein n=1 Tax=Aromia moschata TaxID=1265417 RepID=A0AAV8XJY5_9CUCU|nr:hypothetical protein NQ318_003205 [Aromia moschata]